MRATKVRPGRLPGHPKHTSEGAKLVLKALASSEVGQDQRSWSLVTVLMFWLCAKSLQLCPTICDSKDYSPPGSSFHGILWARILEWVSIPFFRDLPHPGIKRMSLVSPALPGGFFITSATCKALHILELHLFTEDDAVQSERQSVKGLAKVASGSQLV